MDKRVLLLPIIFLLLVSLAFGLNNFAESQSDQGAIAVLDGPPQWQLPKFLREASGLAVFDQQYLLAHNDEKGNIYRIEIATKAIEKLASLGKPPIQNDFEGIAIAGTATYLISSSGFLYKIDDINIDTPRQKVEFERIATGITEICEIEGLHHLDGKLLFPCKTPLIEKYAHRLVVFSYDIEAGETTEFLNLPLDQVAGVKRVHPTAIDADDSHLYIISTNRLLVIDRNDSSARAFSLPKKYHFQPEGIAVLEDGSIVIVDDNRKGLSRITHYGSLSDLKEKTKKKTKVKTEQSPK